MKQPTFNGKELLPLLVIEAAHALSLIHICTLDEYPSDSFVFSAFGYDLHIRDELVAGAFATLPEQEQQILILHCVAAMADGKIGSLVEMSRSAVQRHRTKTLNELRHRLEDSGGRNAK